MDLRRAHQWPQRTYEAQVKVDNYRAAAAAIIFLVDMGYQFTEGYHGPLEQTIRFAGIGAAALMAYGPLQRGLYGYTRTEHPTEADLDYLRSIQRTQLIEESPQGRHLKLIDYDTGELSEEDLN